MKNVRWVVQNNLIAENDCKRLQESCEALDVEFEGVKIIPFSDKFPKFTIDEKVNIYYGSTTFMSNVYKGLNKPMGLFFNEEFSIENYIKKWGDRMLNSGALITTFDEFVNKEYDVDRIFFIRPNADDKSFDGVTMTFGEIKDWHKNFVIYDNVVLNGKTKIVVGEPYNIRKEWRNYIVDGKVVASTLYRENFKLKKSRENIPSDMIEFCESVCKTYQPHKIFAMDVALCGEYYIIECGCFNSVGFYDADIFTLVKEVSSFISNISRVGEVDHLGGFIAHRTQV